MDTRKSTSGYKRSVELGVVVGERRVNAREKDFLSISLKIPPEGLNLTLWTISVCSVSAYKPKNENTQTGQGKHNTAIKRQCVSCLHVLQGPFPSEGVEIAEVIYCNDF